MASNFYKDATGLYGIDKDVALYVLETPCGRTPPLMPLLIFDSGYATQF